MLYFKIPVMMHVHSQEKSDSLERLKREKEQVEKKMAEN